MKVTIKLKDKPLVAPLWEKINITLSLEKDRWQEAEELSKLEPDTYYQLEFKKVGDKKTLSQIGYAWRMISDIASYERHYGHMVSKEDCYRQMVKDFGGQCEVAKMTIEAAKKFKKVWSANGLGWQCETVSIYEIEGTEYEEFIYYYGMSSWDKKTTSDFIEMIKNECKERGIPTIERG